MVACAAEDSAAQPEQQVSAEPDRFAGLDRPGKGIEQSQPAGLELSEVVSSHPERQKLAFDRLQPRLADGGHAEIELLESLAPPGEADRAEHRFASRAHDVAHRAIDGED
jgi:hypothetical protein